MSKSKSPSEKINRCYSEFDGRNVAILNQLVDNDEVKAGDKLIDDGIGYRRVDVINPQEVDEYYLVTKTSEDACFTLLTLTGQRGLTEVKNM